MTGLENIHIYDWAT